MTDRLEEIQILLQKRVARARGPTSSATFNDSIDEISHDLANFADQWTSRLVPLTSTIPDGVTDATVDAFADGLDGRTLYTHHEATVSVATSYYNTSSARPYTIYEQFVNVYQTIELLQEDLESQIDDIITTAAQISIIDSGSLYDSANVEDALAEIMSRVNLLALGGLDLSAVAQHYVPATDNTYDIGSAAKRVRSVYLSGGSLHIHSKITDPSTPPAKSFQWRINTSTGNLELLDGTTVVASYSDAGATFPAGGALTMALDDIDDVDISTPTTGQSLQYDGANWVNGAAALEPGGTSGAVQFRNSGGVFDGNTDLFWDDTTKRLGVGDATPEETVTIVGGVKLSLAEQASAGTLQWDGSNFQGHNGSGWVDLDIQTIVSTIDDLNDVAIVTPASGEYLVYTGSEWENVEIQAVAGVSDLDDLSDVTVTGPTSGEYLVYTGSQWENTSVIATSASPEWTVTDVKTSTYTASIGELVRCDSTVGAFEVDLPEATVGNKGQTVMVKNVTSGLNTITVDPNLAQLIDGKATTTISEAYRALTLISYGDGWGII